jgi:diguanylate cyclase (GGDEF)-like protein
MNQPLLDTILRSPRLPSLPTIAIEVIDLVQQRDVNVKQIAYTISHDPALSGKILRTVNSSFYGLSQPVSTITHALVILGLNSVKTLALGFSLVGKLKDAQADGFDHIGYWKRSLFTAVAARALAREMSLLHQEEAFLGGLLQDLGMLAMSQALGTEYHALIVEAGPAHSAIVRACRARYHTDHAEIGAALAEHWHLPQVLVTPIRFHEQPDSGPHELMPLIRCVALGNRVADIFLTPNPAQALDAYYQQAQAWFKLDRDRAEAILQTAQRHSVETERLFDLPVGAAQESQEILARAHETLLQLSMQREQQSSALEEQNRRLAEQAMTDSLTGVANRRHFNQFATEQFTGSSRTGTPLSLLFLDTDYFKRFNDTYGHLTGDRVLVELASLTRRCVPGSAVVARYGGEEFAIVLPATDRVSAARIAEEVRRAVEACHIEGAQGEALRITVSIGVATHDGGCFDRVEQLVKAADQAVYAAKASGRNCVRVFAPRPRVPQAA